MLRPLHFVLLFVLVLGAMTAPAPSEEGPGEPEVETRAVDGSDVEVPEGKNDLDADASHWGYGGYYNRPRWGWDGYYGGGWNKGWGWGWGGRGWGGYNGGWGGYWG